MTTIYREIPITKEMAKGKHYGVFKETLKWCVRLYEGQITYFDTLKSAKAYIDDAIEFEDKKVHHDFHTFWVFKIVDGQFKAIFVDRSVWSATK